MTGNRFPRSSTIYWKRLKVPHARTAAGIWLDIKLSDLEYAQNVLVLYEDTGKLYFSDRFSDRLAMFGMHLAAERLGWHAAQN